MVCHSAGARCFSEGSASSQDVSRSLILAFAPARSPLSTREAVSTTMARKEERSPSLDAAAASAEAMLRTDGGRASVTTAASQQSSGTIIRTSLRMLIVSLFLHFKVLPRYKSAIGVLRLLGALTHAFPTAFGVSLGPFALKHRKVTRTTMMVRKTLLVTTVPRPMPP